MSAGFPHCSTGWTNLEPGEPCPSCGCALIELETAYGQFLADQHQISARDFDARASSRVGSAGPRGGRVSSFVRAFLARRVKRDERRSRIGGAR